MGRYGTKTTLGAIRPKINLLTDIGNMLLFEFVRSDSYIHMTKIGNKTIVSAIRPVRVDLNTVPGTVRYVNWEYRRAIKP